MFPKDVRLMELSIAVRIPQPGGKYRRFENRAHCGLLIVEYGELFYEQNGRRYRSDNRHILFLPKGINYSMCCTKDSSTFVINFDLAGDDLSDTIQSFECLPTNGLSELLPKLEKLWMLKQSAYRSKCFSLLYTIFAKLECMEGAQSVSAGAREIIRRSIAYLEQNYNCPELSNDALARQSGISTVYFRKLFQSVYGLPPMRYVQTMRIEKAQALLQSGYLSVTEIAEAVGFNSLYHFCRIFKQLEGVSPTQYAQQCARADSSATHPVGD